jgi:hypothetical protein
MRAPLSPKAGAGTCLDKSRSDETTGCVDHPRRLPGIDVFIAPGDPALLHGNIQGVVPVDLRVDDISVPDEEVITLRLRCRNDSRQKKQEKQVLHIR